MAGASALGRYQAREDKPRQNLATMMNFDHMNPEQVRDWKHAYGKWRAGHKQRVEERATYARRKRRGY